MRPFQHKKARRSRQPPLGGGAGHRRRERLERKRLWSRQQAARWALLQSICPTKASQARLAGLISRMTGRDRGSRESALAELELATLLIRAGFSVQVLAESQSKTADLLCRMGAASLYVEVTALVGSLRRPPPSVPLDVRRLEITLGEGVPQPLTGRLLARIAQKAGQLAHYTAPVLLAASVPPPDPREAPRPLDGGEGTTDLVQLGATVTLLLTRLPHLSAVLLTLWNVAPAPARFGLRLSNVEIVERSRHQTAYPRVRMLILNPLAPQPLSGPLVAGLKRLL